MNRFLKLTLTIATGIAHDQPQRRRAMFALTVAALAMLLTGVFLLWAIFALHPFFFAIYWLACLWLVVCLILLAIYDLVMVMRRSREEYTAARKNIFQDLDPH